VTLTRRSTDLTKLIAGLRREPDLEKLPFPIRIACSILQLVAEQNERLATRLDAELGALEELPLRESRPSFFEHTFRLKKELSAAQSDLWRLKGVIANWLSDDWHFPEAMAEKRNSSGGWRATPSIFTKPSSIPRESALTD
jgi:hypothetical protein